MRTAQRLEQISLITSFVVTDFVQDESTIQVIMFIAVLHRLLPERKRRLSWEKSLIILLSEGSKPMRATVTELHKPHRSFQFFSARAGKNIDTTGNLS